jgi:hypothetical protein
VKFLGSIWGGKPNMSGGSLNEVLNIQTNGRTINAEIEIKTK